MVRYLYLVQYLYIGIKKHVTLCLVIQYVERQ